MFGLNRKELLIILVTLTGGFVTILNQTCVTPALPSIMSDMGVEATTVQWLTTAFTLTNAIMIPITAFLTDRYSTRQLFTLAMGVFVCGSALCAWGPAFVVLLCGRILQAAGAGIMMPLGMTVMMRLVPIENRGAAMGGFGVVIGAAPAIGPTLAGAVITYASWHILFGGITVLAIGLVVLSFTMIPQEPPVNAEATIDRLSLLESCFGFGLLLYGFSEIGSNGVSALALASSLVGLIILVLFFRRQLALEEPMLRVELFQNRRFLAATIVGMILQATLVASTVLMPIYLQTFRGYSALTCGLVMLPGALFGLVLNPIVGAAFDKKGPRFLTYVGGVVLFAVTCFFAILSDTTSLTALAVMYALRMVGMTMVNMPITTWAMNSVELEVVNHATSLNNTFRQVAASFGTALIVSVYNFAALHGLEGMDTLASNIWGIDMGFCVASLMCFVAFVLIVTFIKKEENPGQS